MLGELLEDVDPCETVEYVLPLLNGFAMDEGESRHVEARVAVNDGVCIIR